MRYAWHGNAAISLETGGVRLAVDPLFSPAGTYGPWHVPNPHAPDWDSWLRGFAPDWVLITHGHWDHFDLEACRRLDAALAPRFIGTGEVVAVLTGPLGVEAGRCTVLEPGGRLQWPGGLELAAYAGNHWMTGEEGARIAAKLAHHWGAFPCGGAMLQVVLSEGGRRRAYISGDTLLNAVPGLEGVDLAVVNICGRVQHPKTREWVKVATGPEDLEGVIRSVQPRAAAPVHWDFPLMERPITAAELARSAAGAPLLIPAFHTWTPA